MRPQNNPTLNVQKQEDQVENDLMSTIGVHVNESAKIIFNIKQTLYQLVKLNVIANAPLKKYDTTVAIVTGSKRNLDDLRRVQSMLKGYVNTIKPQSSENSEQDIRNINKNQLIISLSNTNQSVTDQEKLDSNIFGQKSQSNLNNFYNINQDQVKQLKSSNEVIAELNDLRQQNNRLRKQVEQSKSKINFQVTKASQDNTYQQKPRFLRRQKSPKNKSTVRDQSRQTKKEAEIQEHRLQAIMSEKSLKLKELQSEVKQNQNCQNEGKERKLQHCKSAILEASHNLHQIRSRNKQALMLIRVIKKQIGLKCTDGPQIQCN